MPDFVALGQAYAALPAHLAVLWGLGFFAGLYGVLCGGTWLLTRYLLPALGIGHRIDATPLRPGQLRHEIAGSAVSILIFGIGSVIPWWFLQAGWARLASDPGPLRVLLEAAALLVWNDVHFYLNHRLLHTRPLRRYHQQHHRSRVPTPFATYSFHPLEAVLLGNVILLPMLVHDFSFAALLSLPVLSLLLNNLGHSNYDFRPAAGHDSWLAASRRHHLHHTRYHGNYGFLLNFMDRWCGTRLPDDAGPACMPHEGA
ncbi:sterol desaturase family protein [Luteimonas sp. BDR2-5]|uniref:sterol desaturase family protein n=1 Tax=Proluteimonas luteida TaxID=2878685 RepID=UPI001E5A633D|nr:sterol desaturase family protein [Luteimonas sp. BDR2-5]MCD9028228.1 sterol desaturase family protein [Luteimonas sp. BDR2-5]